MLIFLNARWRLHHCCKIQSHQSIKFRFHLNLEQAITATSLQSDVSHEHEPELPQNQLCTWRCPIRQITPCRNAGKNAAPSAQNLFSKRPKFTSRPSFADSAAPQGSGKNASTNPAGRTKKPSTGKAGKHFSGKSAKPDRRDTTARLQNHASHAGKRGKKPGQPRAKSPGLGTSKSGTTKSRMSKSGASRLRPGGHGRLKRRASS